MDTQPFPKPTLLLQKLDPLWEHGFHNWAQILGPAPDGRPYFLEERELIWSNPSMRFPLSPNVTHALSYFRATLASLSMTYWQTLRNKITKQTG